MAHLLLFLKVGLFLLQLTQLFLHLLFFLLLFFLLFPLLLFRFLLPRTPHRTSCVLPLLENVRELLDSLAGRSRPIGRRLRRLGIGSWGRSGCGQFVSGCGLLWWRRRCGSLCQQLQWQRLRRERDTSFSLPYSTQLPALPVERVKKIQSKILHRHFFTPFLPELWFPWQL